MASTLFRDRVSSGALFEARKTGVTYNEKRVKDKLDRITAELQGSNSATMSRLAKRYERLEKSMAAMKIKRDELNEKLKGDVGELFDAEDAVVTRVVETVSFTLTMAKEVKGKDKVSVDFENIAAELAKLIPEELQAKVEEITKLYTKITPAGAPVKKLSVAVREGVVDDVKTALKSVAAKIKSFFTWGVAYDKKLAALQSKFVKAKAKPVKESVMSIDDVTSLLESARVGQDADTRRKINAAIRALI